MKKSIILTSAFAALLLTGCQHQSTTNTKSTSATSSSVKHYETKSTNPTPKIDLKKKYKGFKLATVPDQYRGTWYRADPYSKKVEKLIITDHTVNGDVTYQKIDPNFKLDHRSEKQNKEYAGNIVLIELQNNSLKVRGFLDTVSLNYQLGQFKNHNCLFLS